MIELVGFIICVAGAMAAIVGAFRCGGLLIRAVNRFFDWIGEKVGG